MELADKSDAGRVRIAMTKVQGNVMTITKCDIDRKFNLVETKISGLSSKVDKTIGFWVFKIHTESKQELFDELKSGGVYATAEKIYSDIESWNDSGRLSQKLLRYYNEDKRDDVEERLDRVEIKIEERRETGLESLLSGFQQVKQGILSNLPLIAASAARLPYFGKQLSNLLAKKLGGSKGLLK